MKALYICSERESWNKFIGFFRDNLEEVELFCARNASDSMDIIIHESPVAIVIIDDQLQGEDQLTIAEDIFEAAGQKPIVFLSNEEKVKTLITEDFFTSFSTNEVIEKPYTDDNLKKTIAKALNWVKAHEGGEAHKVQEEEEYVPIKLKSFYLHEKLPYDVYYMVYTGNFMKVITKNKRYTESTIQNLAKKNIKDLYLVRSEKIKFLEESIAKAIETLTTEKDDPTRIITTQICGTLLIHEIVNEVGVGESSLQLAELIVSSAFKLVKKYKSFKEMVHQIPITYGDIGEQAIFMLYLNHYLTQELEWESEMTFRKLSLASLIHDSKIKYDDLSLIRHENDEKLKEFNLHSLKIFKEHASLAARVSTEFNNFPDCSFIIDEHHTLPEKKYTHSMSSISCLFVLVRRLTTELSVFGFTKIGFEKALSELKPYDYGSFKKPHDMLIKILS